MHNAKLMAQILSEYANPRCIDWKKGRPLTSVAFYPSSRNYGKYYAAAGSMSFFPAAIFNIWEIAAFSMCKGSSPNLTSNSKRIIGGALLLKKHGAQFSWVSGFRNNNSVRRRKINFLFPRSRENHFELVGRQNKNNC